jgi:predicted nucleic acid-binding protein
LKSRPQYLLDTNVVSETRRPQPDVRVLSFLHGAGNSNLFLSVLVLGELRKGVALKGRSDPVAAKLIEAWVDGMEQSFANRILGIDAATSKLWGEWSGQRPRPVVDTLLAATAHTHGLMLATRNIRDVYDLPILHLDPWLSR